MVERYRSGRSEKAGEVSTAWRACGMFRFGFAPSPLTTGRMSSTLALRVVSRRRDVWCLTASNVRIAPICPADRRSSAGCGGGGVCHAGSVPPRRRHTRCLSLGRGRS